MKNKIKSTQFSGLFFPHLLPSNASQAGTPEAEGAYASPNRQEVMSKISQAIYDTEGTFDFNEYQLNGVNVQVIVVVNGCLGLPKMSQPIPAEPFSPSGTLFNGWSKESLCDLIGDEINHIFQFNRFWNDEVMAKSLLHQLSIIQEAQNDFICQRNLSLSILSPKQKADTLRHFFIQHFAATSPEAPQKSGNNCSEAFDDWLTSTMLDQQYIERKSRDQIQRHINDQAGIEICGGAYGRRLKKARQRLITQLWQKEMMARDA